jgi:hypothetical protein
VSEREREIEKGGERERNFLHKKITGLLLEKINFLVLWLNHI